MKLKWKVLFNGILLLSVITACSDMPNKASYYPNEEAIAVSAKGKGCHLCLMHQKRNLDTYAVLQSAAEATLKSGHKLFAIESPEILKQTTINTAEEYIERCRVHAGDMLAQNDNPCMLRTRNNKLRMVVKVYSDAPLERLTFDAESVLATLQAKELFEPKHSIGHYTVR